MAHQSEHIADPVIVLAIRTEISAAQQPLMAKLDTISAQLATGQTQFALIDKRLDDLEERGGTDRVAKKSMGDKLWSAIAFGAAGTVGGALGAGLLTLLQKGHS